MKIKTVSKGYRLKPNTHDLIEKVRFDLKCSNDKLIKEAVKLYQKKLSRTNRKTKQK